MVASGIWTDDKLNCRILRDISWTDDDIPVDDTYGIWHCVYNGVSLDLFDGIDDETLPMLEIALGRPMSCALVMLLGTACGTPLTRPDGKSDVDFFGTQRIFSSVAALY